MPDARDIALNLDTLDGLDELLLDEGLQATINDSLVELCFSLEVFRPYPCVLCAQLTSHIQDATRMNHLDSQLFVCGQEPCSLLRSVPSS